MTAIRESERLPSSRSRQEHRRSLPHWVYKLYGADGHLLYVGMTYNPVQRFTGWFSDASNTHYRWFREVVRVDWQRHPHWQAARHAEKCAIETDRPIHNRQHQPKAVAA